MTSESSNWTDTKNKMLKEFDDLMDSIESASIKEKLLWKQIYNNAISDRQSANLCFQDLYPHIKTDSDKHAINGPQLSKYLERMEKSNDQLIKLATLVQKAVEAESEDLTDSEDIFNQLHEIRKEGQ